MDSQKISRNINDNKNKQPETHNLTLENRKKLSLLGVKDVISYNDSKILLQTTRGSLEIKGKNLNIQQLNLEKSNLRINGLIKILQYTNKQPATGILKKLFK